MISLRQAFHLGAKLAIVATCISLGLLLGTLAKEVYNEWLAASPVAEGNYDPILRESGAEVVLFSTSTCPYCQRLRELLAKEGVSFKDHALDQSDAGRNLYERLDESGVPVLIAGSTKIVGFREEVVINTLRKIKQNFGSDLHERADVSDKPNALPILTSRAAAFMRYTIPNRVA